MDEINQKAFEKFKQLRSKMKLDIATDLAREKQVAAKNPDLTEEEFQEKFAAPKVVEADMQKIREVDETFNYIESLKLPSNFSLAIGLIISANKTHNPQEIYKAIDALREEIHGKGKETPNGERD